MDRVTKYNALASALIITIVLQKAALLLHHSAIYGRLAIPPVYDDVTYFVDGLERLATLKSQGVIAMLRGLIELPPHSPYSSFGAFFGFLITSGSTVAPYAFNAVALSLITVAFVVLFEVQIISAAIITVIVAATAWFDNAVNIYHPDMIAGYATSVIAATAIFQRHLLYGRKTVFFGICAGLALLIKPTAFIAILAVWSLAFAVGMLASFLGGEAAKSIARRATTVLVCVACVAGPYFAVHFTGLMTYIYQTFVTDIDAWNQIYLLKNGPTERFGFYIDQSWQLFHNWVWLTLGLFVLSFILALRRGALPRVVELLGLLALVLTSYLIPTLATVKLMLFGSLLYGAIVVSLGVLVHLACEEFRFRHPGPRTAKWLLPAYALALVGGCIFADRGDAQQHFPAEMLVEAPQLYDRTYSSLVKTAAEAGKDKAFSVFFPTAGPLPPGAYRFRALKNGIDLAVNYAPLETDISKLKKMSTDFDFIVLPDDALLGTLTRYPVNAELNDLTVWLRSNGNFKEASAVELPKGKMLIFHRTEASGPVGPKAQQP